MRFFTYILRNARRNPVRSLLTIASTAICLFLMMILFSFFEINDSVASTTRAYNRLITLNSQGFAGKLPIARVREISEMDGVVAASPFSWFGGKFNNQVMPFAQFGVDADTFFTIYDEFTLPPEQLKAFSEDKAGCVVGRKLAEERGFKLGEPLPLQGDIYPIDLKLVVRGIYDGPSNRDLRMCVFRYDYLDDALKASTQSGASGNAGAIVIKVKNGDIMVPMCGKIDTAYLNTDNPTRTQTEEAFSKFFVEMLGDLKGMVRWIGAAVLLSLMLVGANALAMALRERTTEVAVLKAIGFSKQLVLFLVLAEAMIVAGLGGFLGTFGSKLLFDVFDLSRYAGGFLPFFFVPWATATFGLTASLIIGFLSGLFPAYRAAQLSVVNGLRKVV
jgi:putative ABC transport system permease protein